MKESPADLIMIAIDACEDRRYIDAKLILLDVPTVIVRTRDAGVHFGRLSFVANAQGGCLRVVLENARRLWSWSGANTLNEIANHGVSDAKVSEPVSTNVIPQVIEIIPCTPVSEKKLNKAKW